MPQDFYHEVVQVQFRDPLDMLQKDSLSSFRNIVGMSWVISYNIGIPFVF